MSNYVYPFFLILSLLLGGASGYFVPQAVPYLKPIGDLFLNLILTCVIPLVFFCVAASFTKYDSRTSAGKLLGKAMGVFLVLGLLAAIYMLMLILIFPLTPSTSFTSKVWTGPAEFKLLSHLSTLVSVPQFSQLFSNEHLLALIVFASLIGMAAKQINNEFVSFLQAGERVFLQVFQLIMKLAPIGFFAYFAGIVHELGPQFMTLYLQVGLVYFTGSLVYFFVFYSLYLYFIGGWNTLTLYWKHLFLPAITAIATCSSAASIPANLTALQKMGVPERLSETILPLGTILHKQGSIMGGMVKIAFLYGIFHLPFHTLPIMLTAIGLSVLVGTVMGAIPSGGLLGELLILHVYGFDPGVLFMIAAISLIIDVPATLLNVTGNTLAVLLLSRHSPK